MPEEEETLASQPTLWRSENSMRRTDLLRLAYALTDTMLDAGRRRRWGKPGRQITVDMDPTEDPSHGHQQLAFFNTFYDSWCDPPIEDSPGSPADRARVRVGERLLTVEGVPCMFASPSAFHRRLWPRPGTKVSLGFAAPDGSGARIVALP